MSCLLSSSSSIIKQVQEEGIPINNDTQLFPSPSRYAYAFVVGGCVPESPSCLGYVYNILVAARILREEGSQSDVVALFSLTPPYKSLSDDALRWLRSMNVKVKYFSENKGPFSFKSLQMQKFRILGLVEYHKVLFLDADVIPSNLDYLFHLSEKGVIKENLILS